MKPEKQTLSLRAKIAQMKPAIALAMDYTVTHKAYKALLETILLTQALR